MVERGLLVLFGGAAGSGKTTLARAWCATRERSAFVELDAVWGLILGGRVDPQVVNEEQSFQYEASARASAALAKTFSDDGFDVAVEAVFEPEVFGRLWEPLLRGYVYRLVVVHPSLEATLERSRAREKRVWEVHTETQHAACSAWAEDVRMDTSGVGIEESLEMVLARLERGAAGG